MMSGPAIEGGVDRGSGGTPAASIIISAENRREYLRAAVESALAQDVRRDRFEVIVVKNFSDPPLDRWLDDVGAFRILSRSGPMSLKVADGVRASRGRVLLPLDDDDLFEPNKVRTVLAEFDAHPSLGFYHNLFSYVGPSGEPLDPRAARYFQVRRPEGERRRFLGEGEGAERMRELAHTYADFNTSSQAIRRDLARWSLPYLERVGGSVDTFLLFVGLVSSCSLLIDNAALTRYRVHGDNATLARGVDPTVRRTRLLEAARVQASAQRVIREMVVDAGNERVLREIEARILVTQLSIIFRDAASRRADAVRALRRALALRQTFVLKENVPSLAGAALFALTPPLARITYDYQVAVR